MAEVAIDFMKFLRAKEQQRIRDELIHFLASEVVWKLRPAAVDFIEANRFDLADLTNVLRTAQQAKPFDKDGIEIHGYTVDEFPICIAVVRMRGSNEVICLGGRLSCDEENLAG